jgi:hypothetical protein
MGSKNGKHAFTDFASLFWRFLTPKLRGSFWYHVGVDLTAALGFGISPNTAGSQSNSMSTKIAALHCYMEHYKQKSAPINDALLYILWVCAA